MLAHARSSLLLAGLAFSSSTTTCTFHSHTSTSHHEESSKVGITLPTTDPKVSMTSAAIDLGGWAAIDAWSSSSLEVQPCVRWTNATSGVSGSASEHVDWSWLVFQYVPSNHTWLATVPLVPGTNEILVEAYYSTSGTVVGSDSIHVDRR